MGRQGEGCGQVAGAPQTIFHRERNFEAALIDPEAVTVFKLPLDKQFIEFKNTACHVEKILLNKSEGNIYT